MAQYRAIFQNAYFKGLATAAVVTMGLAAGQAQATALTDLAAASGDITITGGSDSGNANKWGSITVSGAALTLEHNLTITGGAATDNYIKPKGDNLSIEAPEKNLTINIGSTGTASTDGFTLNTIAGSGSTLSLNKVDVAKGLLVINNNAADSTAQLNAKQINVGTSGSTAETVSAFVKLSKSGSFGTTLSNDTLLSANTQLSIYKDGQILAEKASSTANLTSTINAAVLNIDGGKIIAEGEDAQKASDLTINLISGTMTDGAINVNKGSNLKLDFQDSVNIKKDANVALDKKFDINSGSIDAKGKITVTGPGILSIQDGVVITGGTNG